MTIPEFLDKLRVTEGPWKIEDGHLRCDGLCPIAKLADVASRDWRRGAELLGLDTFDASEIVYASDSIDRYMGGFRSQLLAATVERP